MATDNPFSLDQATPTDPDAQRRKKLTSFGLGGLVRPGPESNDLEQQPLYGGDVNKSVAEAAAEPSQLATERVERAPYIQESTPLLGPEERLGNLETGETAQNTYQPLSQDERSSRVKDFLNQAEEQRQSNEGGGQTFSSSRDVGGAGTSANMAINTAKGANKFGTQFGKSLADLLGGASSASNFANYPSGLSLFGTPTEGFPINPSGLNFTSPDAGSALNPADYSLSGVGGGEAASGAGQIVGQVGSGVAGALSLASLINSLVSGNVDTSKTGIIPKTAMNIGASVLPLVQSIIGPAAGAGLGLSGIGLAYAPMMIPAVMDLIKMFQDPVFPYSSKNISQYRSRAAADQIPGQLNSYLLGQNDPMSLLGLATGAMPLSPNQEIMMKAGGNPWNTDPYNAMLEGVLMGDPQATQDFLRSVEVTSGETGGVHNVNTQATDTYRRQLAHALGLAPEQTEGMFQPNQAPFYDRELKSIQDWETGVRNMGVTDFSGYIPELEQGMKRISEFASPDYQDYGSASPYYQTAPGNIDQSQAATLMDLYQSMIDRYRQPVPAQPGGDQ